MFTQRNIAGLFMFFGLAGLAIAPFTLNSAAAAAKAPNPSIAIAISSGSQLVLSSAEAIAATELMGNVNRNEMVCTHVYRLPIADIGLNCQRSPKDQAVASAIR